jgi:hypothetical protein
VKGRATTCFHLTAWLGRRLDGASCHRWPVAGGALDARQSTRGMEGSSGDSHGMRWWRSAAVQWRKEDSAVGENGWRGAAKFGLCATPIMEEMEWGGHPVGGHTEIRMGGPVGVGGATRAWLTMAMTRVQRRWVARRRGRGRERRERAGEAGEWGRLGVGPG